MIKNKIIRALSFCILLSVSLPMQLSAFSLNINPTKWFVKNQYSQSGQDFEQAKGELVEGKGAEEIKNYVLKQSRKYRDIKEATISTIRNGQVLKVSIPASLLFNANDSVLSSEAQSVLLPAKFIMQTDYFSLIVTGHSDNTGNTRYIRNMAFKRADAVSKWFTENGVQQNQMSVFSFGDEMPLFDNDSMENRNRNRRVTLYFVPNKEMIKKAKRGKLKN